LKRNIGIIAVLFYFYPVFCAAQAVDLPGQDSIPVPESFYLQDDTVSIDFLFNETIQLIPEQLIPEVFKPNPKKATIYAAIFPGLGQMYNRKYWKLPIVYGGFIGFAYGINWNGNQHNGYRKAYIDFIDEDSETNSWMDYRYGPYLREDPANWSSGTRREFSNFLKNRRDMYRRDRDLTYIVAVGIYALWIVDAYVDAQLFDFDISPDLSMRIEPVLFERTAINSRSIGMQLSFAF